MYDIYSKFALSPYFVNTFYSALFLIFAPGLTNIYYTFRPNSPLAKVLPFTIPIIALTQYGFVFRQDMKNFCFTEEEDSYVLR